MGGLYLRQLGAVGVILQLRGWSAVTVATLVWWLAVVRESVAGSTIAGIVVIGALFQIWLFAAVAWLMRRRAMIRPLGVLAAFGMGMLAPIVTHGFAAAPQLSEWQRPIWTAAGCLTLFGTLLLWAAYRRWLVADID